MRNLSLPFCRLVTSVFIFTALADANLWLNTENNSLLGLGYRFFIIFIPIFFVVTKKLPLTISLLLMFLGIVFWITDSFLLGTILICLGISFSGFLLKFLASKTLEGAAYNKISINIGSLFSGFIILFLSKDSFYSFLYVSLFFILTIIFLSYKFEKKSAISYQIPKKTSQRSLMVKASWCLLGIVSGINLMGIFAILPQYILKQGGHDLPHWYGIIIIINSLIIIVLQLSVIKLMEKIPKFLKFIPLFIGVIVLSVPNYFYIHLFLGAVIWSFIITLSECANSYFDKWANDDHSLWYKEVSTGIGAYLTIYIMRSVNSHWATLYIGFIGITLLILSFILLRIDHFRSTVK